MTIWAPGMRCVCVDDSPTCGKLVKSWFGLRKRWVLDGSQLVRGKVYTITRVQEAYDRRLGQAAGTYLAFQLAEVRNIRPDGCFPASRFRPLSETRLDQFRVHLNRRPVELPIADPLVPSPVSASGAAASFGLAPPRPHSLPVSRAANAAQREVVVDPCGIAVPLGAGSVAAVKRFEEIQLSNRIDLHGSHHGASNVGAVPQVVGEIRNV